MTFNEWLKSIFQGSRKPRIVYFDLILCYATNDYFKYLGWQGYNQFDPFIPRHALRR
jgi:hypothetical protein